MEKIHDLYDLCVFKGCINAAHTWGKRLFPFPENTNPMFEIWLENCGNKSILSRSDFATKKFGLCSDHFTPDSFYDEKNKKLRRDAVPEPYSPTFRRLYSMNTSHAGKYDHNYAIVLSETEQILTNYKTSQFPLRRYNAQNRVAVSSDIRNTTQGTNGAKTNVGSPRFKREKSLAQTYSKRNLNCDKNESSKAKASSSIESVTNKKSVGLKTDSRLAAGSTNAVPSLTQNISTNKRGRRAAGSGNRVQGSNSQAGESNLKDREVGILQETNEELRSQNKLLKRLNGQLKQKMMRCDNRNLKLKMMLEKVSSIDGFLNLHRCMNLDVRNMIKEEINKCKMPSNGE